MLDNLLLAPHACAVNPVGVVCDDEVRVSRLFEKYENAGRERAKQFMERDAKAKVKWGQRVSEAFHLSDVFLDNSASRYLDEKSKTPNPDWVIPDELRRFVKLITHAEVVRPRPSETAMHAAYGAQMRSSCLSRQVGAAIVSKSGAIVATGTNEVPRAGGGVYGERLDDEKLDPPPPESRCVYRPEKYCSNTREQREIMAELLRSLGDSGLIDTGAQAGVEDVLAKSRIGELLEFSRAVHAEMDALLSASRSGVSPVGSRVYVTTFPCHYCARHLVAAGVDEVQFIEPYPKSKALALHDDSITREPSGWKPPSEGGQRVLFRPFAGVAPRLYRRAFFKDRELKNKETGAFEMGLPVWGTPWHIGRISYVQLEAELAKQEQSAEEEAGE